ncbi:MAG: hypothetical protein Nkreftii_000242 [Candidatus Nitrospira kreftii]|jgi:hypothetical protein|uniref:Uncharacterized protein n=1 Tax=Candidatus Nitrospira kreftii TaxID=2652173 RepID=A0A7S8FAX6_9BACT|nr:MAG: hypothetical protein Nkreftii_000242 [Candidatus Nitrospira kreftii]
MVKSEQRGQNAEEKREAKLPCEEPSYCLFCGVVGPALLYGHWCGDDGGRFIATV